MILLHKAVKTNKFKTQDLKNLGEELGMPRETWDVPAMYTKYYTNPRSGIRSRPRAERG